jgi:hypothetical protein
MTTYDTYATNANTVAELGQLVADRLGLTFVEHDSYFRGVYLVAGAATHRIEIQPNAIPGDDGEDDLYEPEHAEIQTLLLVSGPHRDSALTARLNSINALVAVRQETA